MKYYIIAGEASGDLHGANLMKALQETDGEAQFRFWGGDKMQAIAGQPVKHIRELAFMGFAEVVANLRTILKNIAFCKDDIVAYKPDAVILIDYPGFNLKIAEFAHQQGIKVMYYISPQVWAWKKNRVFKIRKWVEKMYVILPFEKDFYKEYDYDVEYVGHPLLDELNNRTDDPSFLSSNNLDPDKKIIALLPGSRGQEVKRMLSVMLSVIGGFTSYQFVIAASPTLPESDFEEAVKKGVKVIRGQTYELLAHSHAALVTSGTATLETALMEVPQVVCYKGSFISYQIAKRLVDVPYISLVNLIMEKECVKELIQEELNTQNVKEELQKILDGEAREQMMNDYRELKVKLGGIGASKRAAESMTKFLRE